MVFKRALDVAFLVLHEHSGSLRTREEAGPRLQDLLRAVEVARAVGVTEGDLRAYIAAGMVDRESPFDECGPGEVPLVSVSFTVEPQHVASAVARQMDALVADLSRSLSAGASAARRVSRAEALLGDLLAASRPELPLERREAIAHSLAGNREVLAAVLPELI